MNDRAGMKIAKLPMHGSAFDMTFFSYLHAIILAEERAGYQRRLPPIRDVKLQICGVMIYYARGKWRPPTTDIQPHTLRRRSCIFSNQFVIAPPDDLERWHSDFIVRFLSRTTLATSIPRVSPFPALPQDATTFVVLPYVRAHRTHLQLLPIMLSQIGIMSMCVISRKRPNTESRILVIIKLC